jgi:hypothetical protein
MKHVFRSFSLLLLIGLSLTAARAQDPVSASDRQPTLQQRLIQSEKVRQQKLAALLQRRPQLRQTFRDKKGVYHFLFDVNDLGDPIYYVSRSNLGLATSVNTSKLWSGGGLGLNLQGQDMEVSASRARLGVWEPGALRTSHREFGGQATRATVRDDVAYTTPPASDTDAIGNYDHAAHVAGTMIGQGVQANARGMASQAKLDAYTSQNDRNEMQTAASQGMLASNHSYGPSFVSTTPGLDSLGRYDKSCQEYDEITFNNKDYLQFHAAGNDRGNQFNREYDILIGSAIGKNVAAVGAVNILSGGYTGPASVVMSSFSSWGPTDDGRIKPDFVTPGVQITSAYSTADDAYGTINGTSMASPGAAGSLFLLQQHYKNTKSGAFMRAASLKGIAIHTAEEAGDDPGPDYRFGWGLLNLEKAINVINNTGNGHYMEQASLASGATYRKAFTAAAGPFRATICWTDVPGPVQLYTTAANERTPRLVNDLDLRIIDATNNQVVATLPWKLDPANPANAATKGDNVVDNVEQIVIDNLPTGNYFLQVTHKGTIQQGPQEFSIFATGAPVLQTPVTLRYFNGRMTPAGAVLGWETAREENNANFRIERSRNPNAGPGLAFESIATVPSQAEGGNSITPLTYSFTDTQPMPGMNYYRLMQTDRDGTRTQAGNIVALSHDKAVSVLFPNPLPASGEATLDPPVAHQGYQLTDVLGRVLLRQSEPGVLSRVSLAPLPAGVYLLTIQTETGTQTFRVLR